MTTNSPNRAVLVIVAGGAIICLCLCVLFIGGVFAFRKEVVRVMPELGPVLSEAGQDTPTAVAGLRPSRTLVPTRILLRTEPAAHTQALEPTARPEPTEPGAPTEPPAPTERPAPTDAPGPAEATRTPAPTSTRVAANSLPAEVARSMDEIQQQVIDIRGLQPGGNFTRDVLNRDQLREITISDFNENNTPEDIRNEMIELAALGLLQPGFDLGTFYIDLLSEQIAGQYDIETKEMYVIGDYFGGMERLTYSHEYTHALQDQNFDIQNGLGFDIEPCKLDSERCAGIQALLEGDASLTQMNWFTQYATTQDYADMLEFYNTFQMPVYDRAPDYMKEDFLFPYDAGQKFVEHLYNQGGWEAVNAAYVNVPLSTEQIMHPDRYPDDKPATVQLADFTSNLGDGWQEVDRGVMGEWYTYLILSKGVDTSYRLDADTASAAAEGWRGDAYAAYYNEQSTETVMVVSYEWDTLNDADEFASALVQYATLRFGQPVSSDADQTAWEYSSGYSIFRPSGQASVWVLAPSQAAAEAVWAAIGP